MCINTIKQQLHHGRINVFICLDNCDTQYDKVEFNCFIVGWLRQTAYINTREKNKMQSIIYNTKTQDENKEEKTANTHIHIAKVSNIYIDPHQSTEGEPRCSRIVNRSCSL